MHSASRAPVRTWSIPALCFALALAGCASEGDRKLPGVYRVDIQQGNIIEQEMLDKLRPGMDRNQVKFIMGTPAITDPFHADRWDYVFTLSKSGRRRQQRHITVHFKDDRLWYVEGDVKIGERKSPVDLEARAASVEVPLDRNRPGVFSRLFNALPFVGDDGQKKAPRDDDADEGGEATAQATPDAAPAGADDDTVEATPEPVAPDADSAPDADAP
jgi:outer membrane protein assembly factor BamE